MSLEYWNARAQEFGRTGVSDLRDAPKIDEVTEIQKNILFPILKGALRGHEQLVIDYGCGAGRFSILLSELIDCKVIGLDPIKHYIDIAPTSDFVSYEWAPDGVTQLSSNIADVVWCLQVLGGIESLLEPVNEITRLLIPGGLFFLVENTANLPNSPVWHYRTIQQYLDAFPKIDLKYITSYKEHEQPMAVMLGRKVC